MTISNITKIFTAPRVKKILTFIGISVVAILLGQLAAIIVLKALFTI